MNAQRSEVCCSFYSCSSYGKQCFRVSVYCCSTVVLLYAHIYTHTYCTYVCFSQLLRHVSPSTQQASTFLFCATSPAPALNEAKLQPFSLVSDEFVLINSCCYHSTIIELPTFRRAHAYVFQRQTHRWIYTTAWFSTWKTTSRVLTPPSTCTPTRRGCPRR